MNLRVANNYGNMNPYTVFSLEEEIVGEWTDGRPVYARSFIGAMPAGRVLDDSGDIDFIVELSGSVYYSNAWRTVPLTVGSPAQTAWGGVVVWADHNMAFNSSLIIDPTDAVITVKYTRLSDKQ